MANMYQDVWTPEDGVLIKGDRECESRWEVIRDAVYKRMKHRKGHFSILDLGAAQGYFGFRCLDHFNCSVVMIDKDESLGSRCRGYKSKHPQARLISMNCNLSPTLLYEMSLVERFDIVLCMNFLHHLPLVGMQESVESVRRMAPCVIWETPSSQDRGACGGLAKDFLERYLSTIESKTLGSFESHTDKGSKTAYRKLRISDGQCFSDIRRSFMGSPNHKKVRVTVGVDENGKKKKVKLRSRPRTEAPADVSLATSDWIEGINLRTYQSLGFPVSFRDCCPNKEQVSESILSCHSDIGRDESGSHGDIKPWNIILDGVDAYLIDQNDGDPCCNLSDSEALDLCAKEVREGYLRDVE